MQKVSPKIQARANKAITAGRYDEARLLYERILERMPTDYQALSNLTVALNELGDYDAFYASAQALLAAYPNDPSSLNKAAVADYKLGNYQAGYDKLKKSLSIDPARYDTALNLCTVTGDLGLHKEGLDYALTAVQLQPSSSDAHNNLGAAFNTLGQITEAIHCFETALLLNPDNPFGHVNIGVAMGKQGRHEEAIEHYQKALALTSPTDKQEMSRLRFFLGLTQLTVGQLSDGWKNYEFGWDANSANGRNPNRKFDVPRWTGQSLQEKTVLVWREQGLGDEIFFFSALKDLEKIASNVIVECDARIVPILRRSFPSFKVRPQAYYPEPSGRQYHNDFDYHVPVGSLFAYFRSSIADFKKSTPYVKVDEKTHSVFDRRLGPRNGITRVGICWRSGDLNPHRNSGYTAISDWEALLKLKNVQFVSLQYGDTVKEVAAVTSHFGVSLNSWSDIDRKDDLDAVAALMSSLDLVISVGTAVAQLAAAVGVPVWLLSAQRGWPMFGESCYPTYPNVSVYLPGQGQSLVDVIQGVVVEDLLRLSTASKLNEAVVQ